MRATNSQDLALLSDHVYGDKKSGKLITDTNGQITLNGVTYKVEAQHKNESNGYFGAIYRRVDTNEIIVVHRGTDDTKDAKTDMQMVRDHSNRQYKDAEALTKQAMDIAHKRNIHRIYQTGHSLGGTLAQLCGNNYGQYTETFNAYGAADLKERRHNPNANQFITNHQMGADVVAAAAPHIGKELFYTKPEDNRRLRDGGYGNGNPNDNSYFPNKPSFAISPVFSSLSVGNSLGAMVATHRVTNCHRNGHQSLCRRIARSPLHAHSRRRANEGLLGK